MKLDPITTNLAACAPFKIGRVSIGLSNRTYNNNQAFGEVSVDIGPFCFQAFIELDGSVSLPSTLIDDATTLAVEEAVRAAVLAETVKRWGIEEQHQRARYATRTPRRRPSTMTPVCT